MKNRKFLLTLFSSIVGAVMVTLLVLLGITASQKKFATETVFIRSSGQAIVGQGEIRSMQEAVLHFQTGGKLVYLPLKEGDSVYAGQTIAQLDTYPLQKQLSSSLNNYRLTRDTFDQQQVNAQNGVAAGQQRFILETQNKAGITAGDNENNIINDIVKRIVDENQANLDNSVIGVELSNYALQLASLQTPFSGIVMHEDVTSANQNITSTTSFTIADPTQLIFKATISSRDIDFVTIGSPASVILTGSTDKITGTVTKIYPQRTTTSTGEDVYQIDVAADGLQNTKLGETGVVSVISSNTKPTAIVPTWTIIDHNYIWVFQKNKPILKKITVGMSHTETTEVYAGLKDGDQIIINPQSIASEKYIAL